MRRFAILLSALLYGCFLSCGDTPSSPDDTPTPSNISVEFTGEEKEINGDGSRSVCQVTASWTICPDTDFESYALYRSATSGIAENQGSAEVLVVFDDPNQRTYIDEAVNWGTNYYYAVRTGNSQGKYSWSNEAEILTPGDIPTPSILSATAALTEITLGWTQCPDQDFDYYTLYRSYTPGIETDTLSATKLGTFSESTTNSFIDSTFTQPTAFYALRTVNALGFHAWSNEVSVSVPDGGVVIAWGQNAYGQCDVPSPNVNFVAVAAGDRHSLGLKVDGSVIAWGVNTCGQCDVPSPNTDFVAIACGDWHSLGVKADGSIIAWGRSDYGQCDVPSPNTDFVAVAAGQHHSLGMKTDGSLVAWGWNEFGQCDVPSPNTDFVAIACGDWFSLGVKTDGSIVGWGNNGAGQCEVPSPNTDFIAVEAGDSFSLGLKTDGSIVGWGQNSDGQCNVPSPNTGFIMVAAGHDHGLGLKADGSVKCWGDGQFGQCDVPAPNTNFLWIAGGTQHSLGVRE